MQRLTDEFGAAVPAGTGFLRALGQAFVLPPFLGGILPIADLLILYMLHRVAKNRPSRVAYSLVVLALLGLLIGAVVFTHQMAMSKLAEGLTR